MKCIFIKKDKKQCQANRMTNFEFCFRHDPGNAVKALQASQTGGENRSRSIAFQEEITLTSTQDIQAFLGKVINGVWQGKVPTKVGSSLGFLARCWLDAYEKAELEKRIAALEEKVE